jgi:hypothetical protein
VAYPVHVRRRGSELRGARFRYSIGAGPRFKPWQALRPPREAIRRLGSSGGGRKGAGHGGCPRAALAGRGEVTGAKGELRGVRRGTEEATGKAAGHWDVLYSHGAGVVTGGRGHAGVRARACSERAP